VVLERSEHSRIYLSNGHLMPVDVLGDDRERVLLADALKQLPISESTDTIWPYQR
jgi:hypothetical protein